MAGLDPVAMEVLVHRASPMEGERMTAPGLGGLERVVLSRWPEMVVTAGSVKSPAGTYTASMAVTEAPDTEAMRSCKSATSVASVG